MPVEDERYNKDSYDPEQARKYNKQSNLYDPEGKSYTSGSDYPPQVDMYNQPAGAEVERVEPVFKNMEQQLGATQRQASTNPRRDGDSADDKRLSQQFDEATTSSTEGKPPVTGNTRLPSPSERRALMRNPDDTDKVDQEH